jgi:hypothetical protein
MKLSVQMAAIRRKIKRLEEHRPLMMKRLATMSEGDREVIVHWLDETMAKAKVALENMQQELHNTQKLHLEAERKLD